jgi:hypothetical protein
MELYNFDKKTETANFSVMVDTKERHGYFEHHELGDECGGELLFELTDGKLELVDYDGVAVLPKQVIEALREMDFIVDKEIFE